MNFFLQNISAGLEKCGIGISANPPYLLLAVSGGIDSMVMLHALCALRAENAGKSVKPFILSVVTVNHNMRSAHESRSDALFVQRYCETAGVPCTVKTVPEGRIAELARQRGRGVEEAARFVRYALLEKEARVQNADFVLSAHNRGDQLETLLQRFFQGAAAGISGNASAGIARRRGIFCRPLLDISRAQISAYAETYSVPFREDRTNTDTAYYRNNLRLHIIPVLNEYLCGWDTGVLSGAEKAGETDAFIQTLAQSVVWEAVPPHFCVRTRADNFYNAGFPVRIRALYAAADKTGRCSRIPYVLFKAFAQGRRRTSGSGLELYRSGGFVYVRNTEMCVPDGEKKDGFCTEIKTAGTYSFPFGTVQVLSFSTGQVQKSTFRADNKYGQIYTGPFKLPVNIRSRRSGDRMLTAAGRHKSVKKILSEWRVAPDHKNTVPVIEREGVPLCLWGAPLGYPVWYVKDCTAGERQNRNNAVPSAEDRDTVFLYFTGNLCATASAFAAEYKDSM